MKQKKNRVLKLCFCKNFKDVWKYSENKVLGLFIKPLPYQLKLCKISKMGWYQLFFYFFCLWRERTSLRGRSKNLTFLIFFLHGMGTNHCLTTSIQTYIGQVLFQTFTRLWTKMAQQPFCSQWSEGRNKNRMLECQNICPSPS